MVFDMLGIGFFEIVIIAVVALIAVGPKQLPQVMRKVAGFYRQFLSLRDEFRFQILSADVEKSENNEAEKPKTIIDSDVVLREKDHG